MLSFEHLSIISFGKVSISSIFFLVTLSRCLQFYTLAENMKVSRISSLIKWLLAKRTPRRLCINWMVVNLPVFSSIYFMQNCVWFAFPYHPGEHLLSQISFFFLRCLFLPRLVGLNVHFSKCLIIAAPCFGRLALLFLISKLQSFATSAEVSLLNVFPSRS